MVVIWFSTSNGMGGLMMSLLLFCITFALPHFMHFMNTTNDDSASSSVTQRLRIWQGTALREGYNQNVWMMAQMALPLVFLCACGFALTDCRIRRMLRLGPLENDETASRSSRQRGDEHMKNIASKIRQLPLVEYHTRDDLERMSLHELREVLQHAHVEIRHSKAPKQSILLQDKQDVIRDILGDDDDGGEVCSICQEEYESKQLVRVLPRCGHRYHVECVDQWFLSNQCSQSTQRRISCPLCNTEL